MPRNSPSDARRGRRAAQEGARPSVQDVAKLAGVAVGTVSNVLNNPDRVTEFTRRKVEAAIAELGFVRNFAARTLVAGTTNTVGLVLVDIGNSLFVDIARGAEAATAASGLKLLLANSDVDQAKQDAYLELFDQAQTAGLLLAPLDGPLDAARAIARRGRPIVVVNAPAADPDMCCVAVDEQLGGYLAAHHLIAQGARRLAFVGGPLHLHAIRDRLDGARQAATEASLDLTVIETHALNVRDGRTAGGNLLRQSRRVDGIVCASDPLAVGVINAAAERGVGVPDDLVVVGYDNNHLASESLIPISTIAQPGLRMGEVATQLLLEETQNDPDHRHQTVVLEPHLIARRSSQRRRPTTNRLRTP
ncbi:LacI family DNA-binding transcriptional regulator [Actinoplanes aureus]|uniref:LacI family DNA-binding transcriptional regulator n=1 Tax=Actinoplanes aureus TaxID=2792083 RepID=A0A931G090_9ACTN|nr:LacI family DNA-binding transcriptional regulator [Actinoplanes aureus]MBG0566503.1 LacI family DNA-binding transcriptional regulator [Actinoplanes aureus]